jgi:DMSO reductase anchor subunit
MSEMGWGMFELALLFFFLFALVAGGFIVYGIAKVINEALKERKKNVEKE